VLGVAFPVYRFPDWHANKKASMQNGFIFKGWNARSDTTVLAWDVDLHSPSDAGIHPRITETSMWGLLTFWLLLTCQGWAYQLWYGVIMGHDYIYSHYRVVTTCSLTPWSWGWVVNATPHPLYPVNDPVPIVQEAGWSLGLVWTGAENLTPTRIQFPDRPACNESLYWLCYPNPLILL